MKTKLTNKEKAAALLNEQIEQEIAAGRGDGLQTQYALGALMVVESLRTVSLTTLAAVKRAI